MNRFWGVDADPTAQGRIKGAEPVAVLDIGSNSVRLVVYERHARALTPLYNEKSSCALGRGVASTGRLADKNVALALSAIKRFALVSRLMRAGSVHVLATSAVRDAENGADFAAQVSEIMGVPAKVLSGEEEAHFAALGVVAGMPGFAGVVGDLGGGSLELSAIEAGLDHGGETHALGVIRMQDDSGLSPTKALNIARERLARSRLVAKPPRPVFCAIGGTWRSLAKLDQVRRDYPLHMVQHYATPANELLKLCDAIVRAAGAGRPIPHGDAISSSRRELMPYGAAVMAEVLRNGAFEEVIFSALGVREGYLYNSLPADEQALDPLIEAADEVSILRSRSPAHTDELIAFSDRFFAATGFPESDDERRLRQVACLLSDIGWRGHPDYRGEQSVNMVAHGALIGIDHPGRAFLSQVLGVRYMGLKAKSSSQALLDLAGAAGTVRARLVGALFRVAYPMSAAMPGVLPRTSFSVDENVLVLDLPGDLAFLGQEHLQNRLDQLAGVAGFKGGRIAIAG